MQNSDVYVQLHWIYVIQTLTAFIFSIYRYTVSVNQKVKAITKLFKGTVLQDCESTIELWGMDKVLFTKSSELDKIKC